ncbi:MAG: sulfatase-like hydrolase/transferase [Calditrichaeota bacterium]|nr:sulfatase-like hydrolase/transferase [Calditrichota bacterium]
MFELLRGIILLRYRHLSIDIPSAVLIKSFLIGFRFDLAITGYILAPAVIIGMLPRIGLAASKLTRRIIVIYLIIMAAVAFMMTIIDLEFYGAFNTRLNHIPLDYMDDYGTILKMAWEMSSTLLWVILWAIITFGFGYSLHRITLFSFRRVKRKSPLHQMIIYPLVLGLLFLGIRGRVSYRSPLRWGMAYFSNYHFANQLALNSCFTFIRDTLDSGIREKERKESALIPPDEAWVEVRRLLGIELKDLLPGQTIARQESPKLHPPPLTGRELKGGAHEPRPLNVVLIIMESFSAKLIGSCGGEDLSPDFDLLVNDGLLFPRFYCSGGHTRNALFTIITGLPSLLGRQSYTKRSESQLPFAGLPMLLKERGYVNYSYVTHDPIFDNKRGFFISNCFDNVVGLYDYTSETELSSWGVSDEVLYGKALEDMDGYEEPFLVMLEGSSNHPPFRIPDQPYPRADPSHPDAEMFNAFSYADWAMGRFMESAVSRDWGRRTLFVIFGDTGENYKPTLELDLSWFNTPLLLYCPDIIEPGISDHIGGQKDITATVMDVLGGEWVNNTLGRSLLDADYSGHALFVERESYGFIIENYYLMRGQTGSLSLYNMPSLKLINNHDDIKTSMQLSAEALLSATLNLIETRQVRLP